MWREESRARLVVPLEVAGREARLCIASNGSIVDLRLFLEPGTTERGAAETALAICRVNEALALPGFGFHEESGSVYYRIAAPASQMDRALLAGLMETCAATVSDYFEVIWGSGTVESIPAEAEPFERYDRSAAYALNGPRLPKPKS
jgi:hypothetical protein